MNQVTDSIVKSFLIRFFFDDDHELASEGASVIIQTLALYRAVAEASPQPGRITVAGINDDRQSLGHVDLCIQVSEVNNESRLSLLENFVELFLKEPVSCVMAVDTSSFYGKPDFMFFSNDYENDWSDHSKHYEASCYLDQTGAAAHRVQQQLYQQSRPDLVGLFNHFLGKKL